MDSYGFHFHKHFFPNHPLLIVGCREIGVKEDGNNSIGVLDISANDECNYAWYIQKRVCNHTDLLFPSSMVYLNSENMC